VKVSRNRPFQSDRDDPAGGFRSDEAIAMPITVVHCTLAGCAEPAAYKIAAMWSDGSFSELKSYGFACSDHLGAVFREAEQRREAYAPRPGETLEEIAIYKYEHGKRDRQLQRLWGLEENYRS
jgi:hypothetical protein